MRLEAIENLLDQTALADGNGIDKRAQFGRVLKIPEQLVPGGMLGNRASPAPVLPRTGRDRAAGRLTHRRRESAFLRGTTTSGLFWSSRHRTEPRAPPRRSRPGKPAEPAGWDPPQPGGARLPSADSSPRGLPPDWRSSAHGRDRRAFAAENSDRVRCRADALWPTARNARPPALRRTIPQPSARHAGRRSDARHRGRERSGAPGNPYVKLFNSRARGRSHAAAARLSGSRRPWRRAYRQQR